MPFTAVTKIRFGDVDFAQIVYYPRFFYLFHMAIEDFFDECLGLPYAWTLKQDKIGFPAVHAEADYFTPLRFGDVVGITIRIARVGHKSVEYGFEVRKQGDEQLCARGRMVNVAMSMRTMEGIPIPPRYREAFERYRDDDGASQAAGSSSMGLVD